MNDNIFNGVELDHPCQNCSGHGTHYGGVTCGSCEGSGHEMTDDGRALAAFIRRHGLDKLQQQVDSIEERALGYDSQCE